MGRFLELAALNPELRCHENVPEPAFAAKVSVAARQRYAAIRSAPVRATSLQIPLADRTGCPRERVTLLCSFAKYPPQQTIAVAY